MTADFLTPAELERLTKKTRPERQSAELVKLGIPFRSAGRTLFVAREVAQHWPQWEQTVREAAPRLDLVR